MALMDLGYNFWKPSDLVWDLFAATLSTAKSCLFLYKHEIFVGFKKESGCMKMSMGGFMKVYSF